MYAPLVHRRVGGAGRDRVDGDAVRGELDRERLGERDDRPLGGGVRAEAADDEDVGGRAHVDDPSALALLDHLPRRGAAAVEVAVQVRGEQPVPVVVGRLDDRLHDQPRRVVHPDVDAAEALDCELGQPVDGRAVAGVPLERVEQPRPCAATSAAVSSVSARSIVTTSAPSRASATASAWPIPVAAPVTTARRPCSVRLPPLRIEDVLHALRVAGRPERPLPVVERHDLGHDRLELDRPGLDQPREHGATTQACSRCPS